MRTKSTPAKRPRSSVAVQRAVRAAPPAAQLRAWALAAARAGAEVTLRVVGAAEARRLNRAFRRRGYATNVLSFAYSRLRGDVVLCHPVIRREARAQGKSLAAHYAHLVVHGMLHLQGNDHERAAAAQAMESLESEIIVQLGYPDPYAVQV